MRTPERINRQGGVRWKVRFRHGGKETSETFIEKRDAETFAALMGAGHSVQIKEALAWLERRQAGQRSEDVTTFAVWFEQYVDQLTGVTSRTRDDYRALHRRYLTGLDTLPVEMVTRTHVAQIVNQLEARGLSPKTIKNVVHMLSSCLALAVDDGLVARNPTKRVRLPKQRHDTDETDIFLTGEEFSILHAEIPEHYRPLVLWLVGSGMRWSEATALQKRHVNLAAGTAQVRQAWKRVAGGFEPGPPKTPMARRTVNVATAALVAVQPLLADLAPDDYVFQTSTGRVVRHGNFYSRIWAPAVTRSGLTPRPKIKDMRSTHASWLLSDGVRLEAVQAQLGHEDYSTTRKKYAHLLPAVGVEVGRVASAAMERALAGRVQPLAIEGTSA